MKKILVTEPVLPPLDLFCQELKPVWDSKWVTNMGEKHELLSQELKKVLKVKNLSLFNNGTIALLVALKALGLPPQSEIITTPFTFAATPHCISWNGLTIKFCDINAQNMTIDADKIEKLITPNTSAILGVHVYGFPCDVYKIQKIANQYNLKVLYDAAHAFSTEINGKGIGTFGDISMFSFHATKLYNTIEGGCLTYNDDKLKEKIFNLRNFGIVSEEDVKEVGINGKMNELQSVIGLLNLKNFKEEQEKRAVIFKYYTEALFSIKGIRIPQLDKACTNSYQYFPIVIEDDYPISRDELYLLFKKFNIYTRRYFYPSCSDFDCYKRMESASEENLPVTTYLKKRVLCLPFYGALKDEDLERICNILIRQ